MNITWEAPVNDSSVIGYMVNITDGDNWFTLNTSDTSLVVSRLETGKNYAITVAAFNQYSISLQSEPVHIELQGNSLVIFFSDWKVFYPRNINNLFFWYWYTEERNTEESIKYVGANFLE